MITKACADQYVEFGVNNGYFDYENFEDLSETQYLKLVESLMDMGTNADGALHENHLIGECFVCKDGL